MSKPVELQISQSIIQGRERANRLLRHVAIKIESHVGVPSMDLIIEYCTAHSTKPCILASRYPIVFVRCIQRRVSFLFLVAYRGSTILFKMLKDEKKVSYSTPT